MQVAEKIYLNYIDLLRLDNWSVPGLLDATFNYSNQFRLSRIGDFLIKNRNVINIDDDVTYKRVTVRINNKGVLLRDTEKGKNIGTKKQYLVKSGQFIVSKIDARNGAFGIIPQELNDAIVTNDFPLYDVDAQKINPRFLLLITTTKEFIGFAQSCSSGTTNRQRMDIDMFLNQRIPLPNIEEQEKIVKNYYSKIKEAENLIYQANNLESDIEGYLFEKLGIEKTKAQSKNIGLQLVNFSDVQEWGIDKLFSNSDKSSSKYPLISISSFPKICINLYRGKSPKYKNGTMSFILNQKCNRWNNIDLSFVKTVDEDWLKSISTNFLTKEGDVLINSTGDGTIGRASFITKDFKGLLYDSHILLLRLNPTLINAELFVELFNSEYGQNQVNDIKSAQATKQTELGISNLSRIKFPLIESLKTQNVIVNEIKKMRFLKNNLISQAEQLKFLAEEEFEQTIFR
jgi:type I restriction enzyme, S subunit